MFIWLFKQNIVSFFFIEITCRVQQFFGGWVGDPLNHVNKCIYCVSLPTHFLCSQRFNSLGTLVFTKSTLANLVGCCPSFSCPNVPNTQQKPLETLDKSRCNKPD